MSDMGSYSYVYVLIQAEDNHPFLVVQTETEAIRVQDENPSKYLDYVKVPYKHHN